MKRFGMLIAIGLMLPMQAAQTSVKKHGAAHYIFKIGKIGWYAAQMGTASVVGGYMYKNFAKDWANDFKKIISSSPEFIEVDIGHIYICGLITELSLFASSIKGLSKEFELHRLKKLFQKKRRHIKKK